MDLRCAIDQSRRMIRPRIVVCGYRLYIANTPFEKEGTPPLGGIADGVPEVLKAVRRQIAAGADVMKIMDRREPTTM